MRTEYFDEPSSSFAEACDRADAKQRRLRIATNGGGRQFRSLS
jgi:hypothetical protein